MIQQDNEFRCFLSLESRKYAFIWTLVTTTKNRHHNSETISAKTNTIIALMSQCCFPGQNNLDIQEEETDSFLFLRR